jgi:Gnt-I system low-affinity gluconate transporter
MPGSITHARAEQEVQKRVSSLLLMLVVAGAVAVLLFLVMGLKMHAFVALLLVSFFTALAAGIPPGDVIDVVEEGMGGILGFVAIVVGLGAMFGEILRMTGGAERIARTLVDRFGEERVPWALGITGFVVSIPVFFDVALVLLIPLVYTLTQRYGRSLLYYGIPLVTGLSVAHSLVPPTPGPIAVAGILGADLGWVILFSLVAGIPATIVGGIIFGRYIAGKIEVGVPEEMRREQEEESEDEDSEKTTPGFLAILAIILVPLVLILINTVSGAALPDESLANDVLTLLGHPFSALTIAVLLAFYVLGVRNGYSRQEVQGAANRALEPVGMILLVTGAGGVFGEVLEQAGIGDVLEGFLQATNLPIILVAFLAAFLIRVSLGSATVAAVTAAAIVAPALEGGDFSAPLLGALVVAITAGGTMTSHVNDSGFWLVSRFFGLTEKQTLQSWTVMQTIVGLVAFGVVLVISFFL